MDIIKAIILGIIQGITEFLPISSSGHLSIAQHFLGASGEGSLLFTVLLHLGTLLAVFVVYWRTILALFLEFFVLIKDLVTGKFRWKEMGPTRRMLVMFVISCLPLLLLMIPVGNDQRIMDVVGVLAEDTDVFVEGFCLLFTGCLLLVSTWRYNKLPAIEKQINGKSALFVGIAQMIAASLPGVSRSGSTISTGMLCGISKEYMVRYSFILAVPAVIAANAVKLGDAVKMEADVDILPIVIGVLVAAVVGFFAIKALEWLVKVDKFKIFGYYCLAIGVIVIIAAAVEKLFFMA